MHKPTRLYACNLLPMEQHLPGSLDVLMFLFVFCLLNLLSFFLSYSEFFLPTHFGFRGLLMHLSYSMAHTFSRIPLDEGSFRRRGPYLYNIQYSQDENIHAPGGIRTRNPSKRAATDPRLKTARPMGSDAESLIHVKARIDSKPISFPEHQSLLT
jgi:hypothetical protein